MECTGVDAGQFDDLDRVVAQIIEQLQVVLAPEHGRVVPGAVEAKHASLVEIWRIKSN